MVATAAAATAAAVWNSVKEKKVAVVMDANSETLAFNTCRVLFNCSFLHCLICLVLRLSLAHSLFN